MATFNTITLGVRGGMPNGLREPDPTSSVSDPIYNGSRCRAGFIKPIEKAVAHLIPVRKVPIGCLHRRSTHTATDTWRIKMFPEPFTEFCQVRMIVRFESATPATAACSFNVTGLTTTALTSAVFDTGQVGAELLEGIFQLDNGVATRTVRDVTILSAITSGTLTFFSASFWAVAMTRITTV